MRLKNIFIAFISVVAASCSDDLGVIGTSVQPVSDQIFVAEDSFNIESSTFKTDSIYAKTTTALLGSFNDGIYGNLECDFLAQLYCNDDFYFSKTLINDKLDSAVIRFYYQSYIGDSLAPMQLSVYQLNKELGNELYSNSNPAKYCDKSILLGKKGYTPYNAALSDSLRKVYKSSRFFIDVKMPQSFVDNFYKKFKESPSTFANNENFQKFFPGIYVTNSYSSGSILGIFSTEMRFHFKYRKTTNNHDTVGIVRMDVNEEVYQVNRYKNDEADIAALLTPNPDKAYMKSPAGVFTKLKFPVGAMAQSLKTLDANKKQLAVLNGAKLVISAYRAESSRSKLQPPTAVMLVRESQYDSIMRKQIKYDVDKFPIAAYSSSSNSYTFTNLAKFFSSELSTATSPGATTSVILMPVSITSQDGYGNTTAISHYFQPSAVTLKTTSDKLKLKIVFSK